MIFNIVNGRAKVATINVTTTPSATVTCVNGSMSLTATASSAGAASFIVPKIGTWTITCTKGALTRSGTVSATTVGETKSITLILEKYLYHTGTEDVAWTICGVSDSKESTYLSVYGSGGGGFKTTAKADLTQFTKLHVMFQSRSTDDSPLYVGYTSKVLTRNGGASADISTYNMDKYNSATGTYNVYKELTLDVSAASGSYYIHLFRHGGSGYSYGTIWVNNVWLT